MPDAVRPIATKDHVRRAQSGRDGLALEADDAFLNDPHHVYPRQVLHLDQTIHVGDEEPAGPAGDIENRVRAACAAKIDHHPGNVARREILADGVPAGVAEERLVELAEIVVLGGQDGHVQAFKDRGDPRRSLGQLPVRLVQTDAVREVGLSRPHVGVPDSPR